MYKAKPIKQMSAIKRVLREQKKRSKPNPYYIHD